MTLRWDVDKDVGQRKHSTHPVSHCQDEKKSDILEDRGRWEGQGSLPVAQPELSAPSGGTAVSLYTPLSWGALTPPHPYAVR